MSAATYTIASPAASAVRWRIVLLLMAISFLNHFNRNCMPVAAGPIMDTYGISEVQMGSVYSALLLAYTLCMVPGGWFSDRFGSRAALLLVGFGSALLCAATGLSGWAVASAAPLVWALLLIRGMMGATIAPIYPASGRVLSHWIPFRQRAMSLALVTGAAPVGVACAFPLFGLLSDWYSWQAAFLVTGACTGAVAALWLWYGRNVPAEHPGVNAAELELISAADQAPAPAGNVWRKIEVEALAPPPQGGPALSLIASTGGVAEPIVARPASRGLWGSLFRNRSLWLLTLSYAAVGYVEYLVFYWSEHYFREVLKFSHSRLSAMIPPLTMAACMPLGGWLSDRLMGPLGYRRARAWVALGGMVGCASMLFAATLTTEPLWIVVCFALSLGSIGLTEGPAWATAIDLGGRRGAATSASIVNTGGNGGGVVSPVLTPLVGTMLAGSMGPEAAWARGLWLASLICLLGGLLWLVIDASERR